MVQIQAAEHFAKTLFLGPFEPVPLKSFLAASLASWSSLPPRSRFLLGLIIVSHWPLDSVYVLGTLLGVDLLFHGVGWVSFGMGLHSRS